MADGWGEHGVRRYEERWSNDFDSGPGPHINVDISSFGDLQSTSRSRTFRSNPPVSVYGHLPENRSGASRLPGTCLYCGKYGHTQDRCWKLSPWKPKCHSCGRPGHISAHCTMPPPDPRNTLNTILSAAMDRQIDSDTLHWRGACPRRNSEEVKRSPLIPAPGHYSDAMPSTAWPVTEPSRTGPRVNSRFSPHITRAPYPHDSPFMVSSHAPLAVQYTHQAPLPTSVLHERRPTTPSIASITPQIPSCPLSDDAQLPIESPTSEETGLTNQRDKKFRKFQKSDDCRRDVHLPPSPLGTNHPQSSFPNDSTLGQYSIDHLTLPRIQHEEAGISEDCNMDSTSEAQDVNYPEGTQETPSHFSSAKTQSNARLNVKGINTVRCICNSPAQDEGILVQCDECGIWQHTICVAYEGSDEDAFYCVDCDPEAFRGILHAHGKKAVKASLTAVVKQKYANTGGSKGGPSKRKKKPTGTPMMVPTTTTRRSANDKDFDPLPPDSDQQMQDVKPIITAEPVTTKKRKSNTTEGTPLKRRKTGGGTEMKKARKSTRSDTLSTEPHWRLVKPLTTTQGQSTNGGTRVVLRPSHLSPPKPSTPLKPHVWTSTYSELKNLLPYLSHSVNGVSWSCSDTPVVLLEGAIVVEWNGGMIMNLEMVRAFGGRPCGQEIIKTPRILNPEPGIQRGLTQLSTPPSSVNSEKYASPLTRPNDECICTSGTFNRQCEICTSRKSHVIQPHGSPILAMDSVRHSKSGMPMESSSNLPSYDINTSSPSNTFQLPIPLGTIPSTPTTFSIKRSTTPGPSLSTPPQSSSPSSRSRMPAVATSETTPSPKASPSSPTTPLPPPSEIQALMHAQISKKPILLILSQFSDTLLPFHLDEEYKYSLLDYWFIDSIECKEEVMDDDWFGSDVHSTWRWRFKLSWASVSEPLLEDQQTVLRPWWIPLTQDLSFDCIRRHDLNLIYNPIPLDLMSPHSSVLTRGWYCRTCGKLNEQIFLRRRKCSSRHCQHLDLNDAPGFSLPLDAIREHGQSMPVGFAVYTLPQNSSLKAVPTQWQDGMETYWYNLGPNGSKAGDERIIRHISTGNLPELQVEACELLESIQADVPLRRNSAGTSYVYEADDRNPLTTIPPPLQQAKELMTHNAISYGECEGLFLDSIFVTAWLAAGSKKGSTIDAKKQNVVLFCLGSNTILSLSPKSGFGKASHIPLEMGNLIAFDDNFGDAAFSPSDVLPTDATESIPTEINAVESSVPNSKNLAKSARLKKSEPTLQITLVHGDVLLLSGDEFEAIFNEKDGYEYSCDWVLARASSSSVVAICNNNGIRPAVGQWLKRHGLLFLDRNHLGAAHHVQR